MKKRFLFNNYFVIQKKYICVLYKYNCIQSFFSSIRFNLPGIMQNYIFIQWEKKNAFNEIFLFNDFRYSNLVFYSLVK